MMYVPQAGSENLLPRKGWMDRRATLFLAVGVMLTASVLPTPGKAQLLQSSQRPLGEEEAAELASTAIGPGAGQVTVQAAPGEPGPLTLYLHSNTSFAGSFLIQEFSPICTAPCETTLSPTLTHFAVGLAGDTPVFADDMAQPRPGGGLLLEYTSLEALRITGWAMVAAGLIASLASLLTFEDDGPGTTTWALLGAGTGVELLGFMFTFWEDSAQVTATQHIGN